MTNFDAKTEFGVRWAEFGKNDRAVTKEKFFATEKARETFCNRIEQKDNFWHFEAWYN